jgi:prepilin-type N-terminal cleavage/methylation domain-containing protein
MRDDDGFTLVELLLAIAVTGIILGPLTAAVIVGFSASSEATGRLAESHDAQLATVYFTGDVQSAEAVQPPESCVTGTPLVAFRWEEGDTSPVVKVASYEVATDPVSGEQRLLRHVCTTPGGTRSTVVAHELSTDPTKAPTASCDGGPCGAASDPRDVRLQVTAASGYAFELRGTRRTP